MLALYTQHMKPDRDGLRRWRQAMKRLRQLQTTGGGDAAAQDLLDRFWTDREVSVCAEWEEA